MINRKKQEFTNWENYETHTKTYNIFYLPTTGLRDGQWSPFRLETEGHVQNFAAHQSQPRYTYDARNPVTQLYRPQKTATMLSSRCTVAFA